MRKGLENLDFALQILEEFRAETIALYSFDSHLLARVLNRIEVTVADGMIERYLMVSLVNGRKATFPNVSDDYVWFGVVLFPVGGCGRCPSERLNRMGHNKRGVRRGVIWSEYSN